MLANIPKCNRRGYTNVKSGPEGPSATHIHDWHIHHHDIIYGKRSVVGQPHGSSIFMRWHRATSFTSSRSSTFCAAGAIERPEQYAAKHNNIELLCMILGNDRHIAPPLHPNRRPYLDSWAIILHGPYFDTLRSSAFVRQSLSRSFCEILCPKNIANLRLAAAATNQQPTSAGGTHEHPQQAPSKPDISYHVDLNDSPP